MTDQDGTFNGWLAREFGIDDIIDASDDVQDAVARALASELGLKGPGVSEPRIALIQSLWFARSTRATPGHLASTRDALALLKFQLARLGRNLEALEQSSSWRSMAHGIASSSLTPTDKTRLLAILGMTTVDGHVRMGRLALMWPASSQAARNKAVLRLAKRAESAGVHLRVIGAKSDGGARRVTIEPA